MADGNLPDLMEYNWGVDYPGGPEKAIRDGVIIPLMMCSKNIVRIL